MKRISVLPVVFAILSVLLLGTVTAQAQSDRGGSAFLQYDQNNPCTGVIKNYNDTRPGGARDQIQSNLQTMYNNGQRKLTVQVWHYRGAPSCGPAGANGTNMNSNVMRADGTCCDYHEFEY